MNEFQAPVEEPVLAATTARPATDARPRLLPPFAVVMLNDDLHTFEYVVQALCRICGHNRVQAFRMALQIHEQGRAIVWSGSKEVAELKRDQIKGFGVDHFALHPVTFPMGVHIEPLP